MITNIFLGLILGVVITSFIILNNKINRIEFNTKFIIDVLKNINNYTNSSNSNIEHLLDRFNKRILVNEEHFNIIKDIINSRFKDLENAASSIYSRLNVLDTDTQNHIIDEHRLTRRQIEKQAKISSKINSKRKQSNNTQK